MSRDNFAIVDKFFSDYDRDKILELIQDKLFNLILIREAVTVYISKEIKEGTRPEDYQFTVISIDELDRQNFDNRFVVLHLIGEMIQAYIHRYEVHKDIVLMNHGISEENGSNDCQWLIILPSSIEMLTKLANNREVNIGVLTDLFDELLQSNGKPTNDNIKRSEYCLGAAFHYLKKEDSR